MSTDLRGIYQSNFFEKQVMLSVFVSDKSRYRVLANTLPWPELAAVALFIVIQNRPETRT